MLKKIPCIILVSVIITCYAALRTVEYKSAQSNIIEENEVIDPAITSLLQLCNIEHDGTLESIVQATQKEQSLGGWIRKPGTERWHMEESEQYKQHNTVILRLFDDLTMRATIKPTKKEYDYALFLGATIDRVRSRLSTLLTLWNEGVRFNELVILGSDRALDPVIENDEKLLEGNNYGLTIKRDWQMAAKPHTEFEMITMVINQVELPQGFERVKITLINTPNFKNNDGSVRRANTGDTIKSWIKTDPKAGSILAISNQPYVRYQDACIRTYVPNTFSIETVGEQSSEEEKLSTLFDTLARWLWQEKERRRVLTA